jgi:hypothetical protein
VHTHNVAAISDRPCRVCRRKWRARAGKIVTPEHQTRALRGQDARLGGAKPRASGSGDESEIAIDQGARVLDSEGEQLLGQDCDDVGREKVVVFGRDLDPAA